VSNNKKILILNTGGTFNKIYHEVSGKLIIPQNNNQIKKLLNTAKVSNCIIDGLLYKDSLEINNDDRVKIKNYILNCKYKKIIIIHGTDTIDKTAKFLSKHVKDKTVILTGSMMPYSINKVEASANLMLAFGSIVEKNKNNIYIAMHGKIKKHNKITKNREQGVFECKN